MERDDLGEDAQRDEARGPTAEGKPDRAVDGGHPLRRKPVRFEVRADLGRLRLRPEHSHVGRAGVLAEDPPRDLEVARGILRQDPGPAYVGMLGSKTKSAEIRAHLEADGFPPERVTSVHCPVGLPLGGRSPGLVALSILAEVVAFHHRQLADAHARLKGRAP